MLYSFFCEDAPNSLSLRKQHRPAHIDRLTTLLNEGRLILAGPNPAIDAEAPAEAGYTGSLIVAQFENLNAAQQWADEEPFLKAGVYQSITVKPFVQSMP
ncbi:YciI family protein [Marinibactrum halimedae]|uniref:YCII-related domain-containing protein n=1 Tax=Marinibactrum halimedae TaxID=1444977 RepID=A0AA37T3N4_9GAMM|nr:YciI family protein [Marinibactrum halimedae]MCD9458418.1 YciI family protein [Marinibactrum halimedae]GLS26115.1 hypothetical protein GCM10007877_18300 [Marinibactrum halimedae]